MSNEEAICLLDMYRYIVNVRLSENEKKDDDNPYTMFINAIDVAINSLKKQVPMKVRLIDEDADICACPVCDETLFTSCRANYCDNCGQALNWNEKIDEEIIDKMSPTDERTRSDWKED